MPTKSADAPLGSSWANFAPTTLPPETLERDPAMANSEVITLKCGRKLGYCQHGAIADGEPVVFFPGAGFGRTCVPTPDPGLLAREGVRLISVDRPGYGLSDRDPGRTLRDWAGDVRELMERLGLDGGDGEQSDGIDTGLGDGKNQKKAKTKRVRFLAHSAGTPHLAAVLAFEPALAKAGAAFVCPVSPIVGDPPDDRPAETAWSRVLGRFCLLRCGGLLDGIFGAAFGRWQADPATFATDLEKQIVAKKDAEFMEQNREFFRGRFVQDFGDAVRPPNGVDAMLDDMFRVNRKAWGFSYSDAAVAVGKAGAAGNAGQPPTVAVWWGSDDDTAPHGEWVCRQLGVSPGRCRVEGGGHGIIHSELGPILRDLLRLGGGGNDE